MSRVLLLSPGFSPLRIISWEAAVTLIYQQKADVVEEYDEEIKSPSVTWKMPAIIRLKKNMPSMKRGIKFSRINIFQRDRFSCQYCGQRQLMRDLTYDHVIPRIRGGKTEWLNIVAACRNCNSKKAGRTPEEAGMKLLRPPFRPKSLPMSYLQLDRKTIPEVWKNYCNVQTVEEDGQGLFLLTA